MSNTQNERRARMLEKVRKLLAMGRDRRGNGNESETAMRQANKIMAEFGIAEAECDMAMINAGEMVFGTTQCGPDGKPPKQGKVYRSCPTYASVLAVGVARFTDSVVIRKSSEHGELLVFQGEQQDVLLASWLFGVLISSIQSEQKSSGWTGRGEAATFRVAASSALAKRLRGLAAERAAMFEKAKAESNSRALMVVDHKRSEIIAKFGKQKTKGVRTRSADSGAFIAGAQAGQRINIPSGRPISGSNKLLN